MNHFEREEFLECSIKELKNVNRQLENLSLKKVELMESIILAVGHNHEGQRSYGCGPWKIVVKTPFVYALNKNLYESGEWKIPSAFNPIKTHIAYSIDKIMCDTYIATAPADVRAALIELIDKKPGKASVTIQEGC